MTVGLALNEGDLVIQELLGNKDAYKHAWTEQVNNYCCSVIFQHVQFVVTNTEIVYGSSLQKFICNQLKIPPQHLLSFWQTMDASASHDALEKKDKLFQMLLRNNSNISSFL